jgi:hypothetical protein
MSCHSSPPTRESSSAPPLRAGLIALSLLIGGALASPAVADDALNARVRSVLAVYCGPCREMSGGAELDLGTITRDPNLVRPGNPEGSPAYTDLVRRIGSTAPTASADELGALRGWITSLPATANLYREVEAERISNIAVELIEKEQDEKYKKKYLSIWKKKV